MNRDAGGREPEFLPAPESTGGPPGVDVGARLQRCRLLVQLLVLVLLAATAAGLWLRDRIEHDTALNLGLLRGQQQLATRLRASALAADRGVVDAFERLRKERALFAAKLEDLHRRAESGGAVADLAGTVPPLVPVRAAWNGLGPYLDRALAQEDPVLGLRDDLQLLESSLLGMFDATQVLARVAAAGGWSAAQLHDALMQPVLVKRILDTVQSILRTRVHGAGGLAGIADRVSSDNELLLAIGQVNNGLLLGDASVGIERLKDDTNRKLLERIGVLYRQATETLRNLSHNALNLDRRRGAARAARLDGEHRLAALVEAVNRAGDRYHADTGRAAALLDAAAAGTALAAAALLFALWRLGRRLRAVRVAAEAARAEERAIEELVEEIETLARGDLTLRARVTPTAAGAVAVALNRAVDALGGLLGDMDRTSLELAAAARTTQLTATRLDEACTRQTDEIGRAAGTVHDSASSAAGVSSQARDAAQAGQQARDDMRSLAATVREAREGVQGVDEAVRDGTGAVRRLAEVSGRIEDVAAQVAEIGSYAGVLALNAAIQASGAGPGGHGFAVVAEDVQRLADRVGDAAQRTSGVARALQTETAEALRALERAGSRVTAGAGRTGAAEEEVREMDRLLQDLTRRIAAVVQSSEQQASRATALARSMHAIQDLGAGSGTGAHAAAGSAAQVAELADGVRRALAGFRLQHRGEEGTVVSLRRAQADAGEEPGEDAAAEGRDTRDGGAGPDGDSGARAG